jgi:hypothetical protein
MELFLDSGYDSWSVEDGKFQDESEEEITKLQKELTLEDENNLLKTNLLNVRNTFQTVVSQFQSIESITSKLKSCKLELPRDEKKELFHDLQREIIDVHSQCTKSSK